MMIRKLLIFTAFIISAPVFAQDQDPWTRYMMPAEVHEDLQKLEGDWKVKVNFWMTGEGEPQVFELDAGIAMMLGGRFLEITQQGIMADMPFQSLSFLGFNNVSEELTLTVLNNMGTGTLTLSGKWSEKFKTADLTGSLINPMNAKPVMIRQKLNIQSKDKFSIENFDRDGESKEVRTVLYEFSRTKKEVKDEHEQHHRE